MLGLLIKHPGIWIFLNELLGSKWIDLVDGLNVDSEVYDARNGKSKPIG